MPIFEYGEDALKHLKARDKRLGIAIERIGRVEREVIPGLFEALVNSVVGQQVSMKAAETVWARIQERFAPLTPEHLLQLTPEELRSVGISLRKAGYIQDIAQAALSGELDIAALSQLPNEAVCERLSALRGIGVWTAEMMLLFSMRRMDVLSWGDLGIRRGLMILYHHKELTRERFERYRKRYSPYGSVASLYLWEISKGR